MLRISLHVARLLTRIMLIGAVLLLCLGAGALLALRYWVLPDIERYHDDITASASQIIGQPVTIGKIEADWRSLRPHLIFSDVRILDKQGQTALALPHVDNVLSWMTLLAGEIRLYSLEIDGPDLLVKRDAQGLLHIAGVDMSAQISGQSSAADWLLHQSRIVVRDARIIWQDDQRAAPPLALNQVNLIIENSGFLDSLEFIKNSGLIGNPERRHRFALHAQPPAELSAQLDVRGSFDGSSFDDLYSWSGELYAQLDYADVAAWRTWLPLPIALKRGRGAVRGWLGVEQGRVQHLTADLALAEVQTQLADDLPPLDVHELRGRLAWQNRVQGFEVVTRKFSLQMNDGLLLPPTDFYLRLDEANGEQVAGGEIRANTLELTSLTSLTDFLPLQYKLKEQLAAFAPQGHVSDLQLKWQGNAQQLLHYEVKARFNEMSLRRVDNFPGFSGLTGQINGSDASGSLSLYAHNMAVDAPQIMVEPLLFDTFNAQVVWQKNERGVEIKFNNVAAANADLAGNFSGSYQTLAQGPGLIDLNVNLTRAAVRQTYRYIPLHALGGTAHTWVRHGLVDGQADQFALRLQGDMRDFPFEGDRKGVFKISAHAQGVAVEYVAGWPRIEQGNAELLIHGKRLEVTAPTAMTAGGKLQKVSVVLPDMLSPELVLQIRGEAVDETRRSLDFIQQSPVRGYIKGFTDGIKVRGNGILKLAVDVPLRGGKPVTVSGNYRFLENEVDFGRGLPTLKKTNGDLIFTETALHTQNATAQVLGGTAAFTVKSGAGGSIHAQASGRTDMDVLHQSEAHPLLHYLHGGNSWEGEITVQDKQANVVLTADLLGLSSDLPAPFAKRADESLLLRLEKKSIDMKQDRVFLQYSNFLHAQLLRVENNGTRSIKRGLISFGKPGKWPTRNGLTLSGTLPRLSLEGWGTLLSGNNSAQAEPSMPITISAINLLIQKISGYGYKTDDLRINANSRNGMLIAQLASAAINGEVKWQAPGQGKLLAHLRSVALDKDADYKEPTINSPITQGASGKQINEKNKKIPTHADLPEHTVSTEFPALDLTVDSILLNGNPLGKLEFLAQQHERDWVVERVRLSNPDGTLTADGKWYSSAGAERTQLNLKLEISNVGNILARSGYPNSVKRGSGKLEGSFAWAGGPPQFSYAILDGTLKLDTGKGQFLKIDPGVGKLLGILSLQALPRHITLDFADVFSAGFAFDSINGTAQIKQGILSTQDFKIEGSAAKATMLGQVDLDKETLNLRVLILPTVGNSVSLLGALAAGPAVGVGVFLANKILREPLDKLVSFEYNVSGMWATPQVEKVARNKPVK
ncbi:MAG: YhdP family protein [Gallionellaceae bacterium]|nr:YhdP family protein [Gallionellaceae bacterium]